MFTAAQYELFDFGDGRKLERFGGCLLDRPSPAAEHEAKARPAVWRDAAGRYDRTQGELGKWTWRAPPPDPWTISFGPFSLELRATEFGHVGVFPEQADNWDWLARQVNRAGSPPRVLNLFAYSG